MELSKEKNLRIFGNFKDSKNNATKFLDNPNPYHQIAGDQDGKQSIRLEFMEYLKVSW